MAARNIPDVFLFRGIGKWVPSGPESLGPRSPVKYGTTHVKRELEDQLLQREQWIGIRESVYVPTRNNEKVFSRRTLDGLKLYRPTRLQFLFPHAEGERTDEWFELTFKDLYVRIKHFGKQFFSADVFPSETRVSPWLLEKFSPQFLDYVSQISRQDNASGGWDSLLINARQRSYLVAGVLSKVLHHCVFSELLWGATATQKRLLHSHDEATIAEEGYKRTQARAHLIRDALDEEILTENFWPEVDQLAARTTSLLLPLINLQGMAAPNMVWPSLAEIHQQIHNIIAEAAYFSICMRLSTSVFQVTFSDPGDHWELEYDQVDEDLYQASKKQTQYYDERQEALVESANEGQKAVRQKRPMRMAKVQIVLWPLIRRYKPLGEVGWYGAAEGERVTMLSKSRVVYYFGASDLQGDALERNPSLAKHIRAQEWEVVRWGLPPLAAPVIVAVLVLLAALSMALR